MKTTTIISIIVLLTLTACSSSYQFDEGKITETDSTATIEFKPLEMTDGVFVTEKGTYDKTTKELTLEYEFDWKFGDNELEYRVFIPKDLAEHVDELTFSQEPDTIINPDPEMSWLIKRDKYLDRRIDIMMLSPVEALEAFDLLKYHARIKQCMRADDREDQCFYELLTNHKDLFNRYDCEGMGDSSKIQACKAFVEHHPGHCGDDKECTKTFFNLEAKKCDDEDCIIKTAKLTKYSQGCELVFNKDKNKRCMAALSQDDSYCNDLLPDNEAYDECCMLITDEAQRERCLAYNDEEDSSTSISESSEDTDCESMEEGSWKNMCWRLKSKRDCDVSACLALADESKHRDCIMKMGTQCGVERCEYLKDEKFYIQCIASSATTAADCDKIEGEFQPLYSRLTYNKAYCLEQLQS